MLSVSVITVLPVMSLAVGYCVCEDNLAKSRWTHRFSSLYLTFTPYINVLLQKKGWAGKYLFTGSVKFYAISALQSL